MGKSVAIPHLLARLMEIPGKERHSRDCQRLVHAKNTDFCQECKNIIEDQCMKHSEYRWHLTCFKCKHCDRALHENNATMVNLQLYCTSCANTSPYHFDYVSKLAQYSYLLRIALSRLCNLMQITGNKKKKKTFKKNFPAYLLCFFPLLRLSTIYCGLFYETEQHQSKPYS